MLHAHAPTSLPMGSCAGRGGGQCAPDVKVLQTSKCRVSTPLPECVSHTNSLAIPHHENRYQG